MKLDILQTDPILLLDTPTKTLTEAVRAIENWTERHAQALEQLYKARIAELLTQQSDSNTLRAFHHHITAAGTLMAANNPALDDAAERWSGMASILSARIGAISTQNSRPIKRVWVIEKDGAPIEHNEGTNALAFIYPRGAEAWHQTTPTVRLDREKAVAYVSVHELEALLKMPKEALRVDLEDLVRRAKKGTPE